MIDFGTVRPGTTLYIPFATYDSNDPTASVTMTGLATTDIEIYKDGGTTQRASDNGYTLLDTDGIDFDGITGIHGFSINLADNTTGGFYSAGSQYWVVVSSVTIDAGTINFVAATFRIGQHNAILNTTIATLASQTSFTLTTGPAEDNALVGCVIYFHDVASAVQCGFGVVTAYTGSTRTVTLAAGPTYTIAATDNVSVFFPANTQYFGSTPVTGRDLGASVLLSSGTGTGQVSLTSGAVTAGTVSDKTGYSLTATTGLGNQTANITGTMTTVTNLTNAPTAGDFTATMKTSLNAATPAVTVSDKTGFSLSTAGIKAIWDQLTSALTTAGSVGKKLADWVLGADSKVLLSSDAHTGATIPTVTTLTGHTPQTGDSFARIGAAGAGLTALPWNAAWDAEVQSECADALVAYDPPTNAEMEARTLPAATYFDPATDGVNILQVNSVTLAGAGAAGDPWRPFSEL